MFEIMQKLNPDFIIEASTFDSTFDDPNVSSSTTTPDATATPAPTSQADNLNSLMQNIRQSII